MPKILILDDEEDIGAALADALEYFGHEIPTVVTAGQAAIELLQNGDYALAVIDAKLSGRISGIDVIKSCRELPKRPKIFAMSGITKSDLTAMLERERLMDIVDRVLEKPLDIQPREFVMLLERLGVV